MEVPLTGEEDSSSSSEPSECSDPFGPVPGSLETDLDLDTSRSLDKLVRSFCFFSWSGAGVSGSSLLEELSAWGLDAAAEDMGFHEPAVAEGPPLSLAAFGEEDFISFTGEDEVDLAGDELSDRPSLESDLDLDLFMPAETDLDFDRLPLFFGDLDLLFPGSGECDFDLRLRDKDRDLERFPDLGGERFLLAGDRDRLLTGDRDLDRRLEGGVLDVVLLRGLLDLERRLRLRTTTERDLVRLLLRNDRERERLDLGGGDLLRLDRDRLRDRLPNARLPGDRDLERRAVRLDLEWDLRVLVSDRDREHLPTAPPRLGERDLVRFVPPRGRDSDLRLFLGDRDREGDLLPPRLGDRESFPLGDGELLRRFGETDKEGLRPLGDLDFLLGFETFFLGVTEREVERDRQMALLGDFGDGE